MGSLRSTLLAVLVAFSGCTGLLGERLDGETVTAACGLCIFRQEARGCYWAISWEGSYYPVNGPVPPDHDAHGPEGMCRVPRQAVVSGRIRKGQLYADSFELLPLAPGTVAPSGAAHAHDHGAGWTGR